MPFFIFKNKNKNKKVWKTTNKSKKLCIRIC